MGRHCGTGCRPSDAGRYAGGGVRVAERTPDQVPPPSTCGAGGEDAWPRENTVGNGGVGRRVRLRLACVLAGTRATRTAGTVGAAGGTPLHRRASSPPLLRPADRVRFVAATGLSPRGCQLASSRARTRTAAGAIRNGPG